MAKKKAAKKRGRRIGKARPVPKKVQYFCSLAIGGVRRAKAMLEKLAPRSRKAWAELHHCESRLSRLV